MRYKVTLVPANGLNYRFKLFYLYYGGQIKVIYKMLPLAHSHGRCCQVINYR